MKKSKRGKRGARGGARVQRRAPIAGLRSFAAELRNMFAQEAAKPSVSAELVEQLQAINTASAKALQLIGVQGEATAETAAPRVRRGRKPGRKAATAAPADATAASAPRPRGRQKKAAPEVDAAFQSKVVSFIQKNGKITRGEATELTGETSIKAGYLLRQMAEQGTLVMRGTRRGAYYEIKGQKAVAAAAAPAAAPAVKAKATKAAAVTVVEEGPTDEDLAAIEEGTEVIGDPDVESVEAIADAELSAASEGEEDQPQSPPLAPPRRVARSPLH